MNRITIEKLNEQAKAEGITYILKGNTVYAQYSNAPNLLLSPIHTWESWDSEKFINFTYIYRVSSKQVVSIGLGSRAITVTKMENVTPSMELPVRGERKYTS